MEFYVAVIAVVCMVSFMEKMMRNMSFKDARIPYNIILS